MMVYAPNGDIIMQPNFPSIVDHQGIRLEGSVILIADRDTIPAAPANYLLNHPPGRQSPPHTVPNEVGQVQDEILEEEAQEADSTSSVQNSTTSSNLEAGSTAPLRPSSSRPPPTVSGDFAPLATSTESPPKGINPTPIRMDTSGILPLPIQEPQPGPSRPDTSVPLDRPPAETGTKRKNHPKKVILKHRPKKYEQPTLEDFTRPRTNNILPLPRNNLPTFPDLPLPVPALPDRDLQNPVEDSSTPKGSPEREQPPRLLHHKIMAKRKEVTPPQSPRHPKHPKQLPLQERSQTSIKAPSCSSMYRTAQETNEEEEQQVAQGSGGQEWRNILLIGEMSQEDQETARNIEQDFETQDPIIEQAVISTDFKSRLSNTLLRQFSPRNSPNTTPPDDQVDAQNDEPDIDITRDFHPDHIDIPEVRVISEDEGVEEDGHDVHPSPQGLAPDSNHDQSPQSQQMDSIEELLGPSTETSASNMDEDDDPRANDLSRSNVMSQSSVIIIESSQDGDTSNEMGTKSEKSTDQTPPDPPTPLGALDHLNRQESSLPGPSQPRQPTPPPIVMVAPVVQVQNPDLVMFNVADTVTASATIRDAQPDPNRTPDQVLIEVDLNYNIHHVLTFRNNYSTDTIVNAWFNDRVVVDENDEGFQTSAMSALDSNPSITIDEFRLVTDFSRLNSNLSSTNATAGSSQSSTEVTPSPQVEPGQEVTFAQAGETPDDSHEDPSAPDLVITDDEDPQGEGEEREGPRE